MEEGGCVGGGKDGVQSCVCSFAWSASLPSKTVPARSALSFHDRREGFGPTGEMTLT